MEGVPGDLQAKYQKIAAEYSKVVYFFVVHTSNLKTTLILDVIICKFFTFYIDESTSQCVEKGCGRRANS